MVELRRERRLKYFRTFVMIAIFSVVFVFSSSGVLSNKSGSASKWMYRTIWVTKDEPPESKLATIAVVRVNGVIIGDPLAGDTLSTGLFGTETNMVARLRNQLIKIAKEKKNGTHIATLVLYIDSPGGTVSASDEIFKLVRGWKTEHGVRVVAYLSTVAASGGYYIAQATDEIVANETTITGSIGVIISSMNFSELARRFGIGIDTIKSGKYKDMGSSFRTMSADEKKIFQELINESFASFVTVVEEGRKGKMTRQEILKAADGRIYTGKQAKTLKLVDDTASFDTLVLKETGRIVKADSRYEGAKIMIYHQTTSFFDRLFSTLRVNLADFLPQELKKEFELLYLWPAGV